MKIVSFETAKLAKEKTFNEKCEYHYQYFINDGGYELIHYEDNGSAHGFQELHMNSIATIRGNLEYSAPYQYQLLDWLREEYKIFVTIYPYIKTSLNNWQSCVWVYPLNENKEITGSAMYYNFGTGLGYYECLETALQEALKMI